MIIIYILCFLGGIGITYLILRKKLLQKQELDLTELNNLNNQLKNLKTEQDKLQKENLFLEDNKLNIQEDIIQLLSDKKEIVRITNDLIQKKENSNKEYNTLKATNLALETLRNELLVGLDTLELQQLDAALRFYKNALKLAELAFDTEIDNINKELTSRREEVDEIYRKEMADYAHSFLILTQNAKKELQDLNLQLEETRSIVASAVADRKRAEEMVTKQDFYRLLLSKEDIEEIKKLREVLPYLRDKEPLNKVIYKVYYEKPYTALVGRVLGTEKHIGIYKITNIENGMTYVGLSLNGSERWRLHIKRGVGAEPATRNKLYPAMLSIGVENFTFEWIEDCEPNKLDEREQFWQEFFHAKDYGYSIK